jgi:YjbE family integral membrane protein
VVTTLQAAEFWARFSEIGFLNLLLSGDNAVVIALAVRTLPRRQRLLGQVWGTVGAVVLRLIFVGIVSALLHVSFLRLVGGALLIWIAVKLVQPARPGRNAVRQGSSFWEAIGIIMVADLTMSLDNVLAIAAAAHGDMLLVGLGIATSLPIVIWGSSVLARLMDRHVWIIWVGAGLLGYVAGEMILDDPLVFRHIEALGAGVAGHAGAVVLGAAIAVLGWWLSRRAPQSAARRSASAQAEPRPRAKRRGSGTA